MSSPKPFSDRWSGSVVFLALFIFLPRCVDSGDWFSGALLECQVVCKDPFL